MTTISRTWATLAATALLALGAGAGVTAAHDGDRGKGERGHSAAAKCERLDEKIAELQRKKEKLAAKTARVQAKITAGGLTQEQLDRANAKLAKIAEKLARLDAKLAVLTAQKTERCSVPVTTTTTTTTSGSS